MSEPSYKEYEDLLRILYRQKYKKNKVIIHGLNNSIIKAIIEIAYNILKGSIPIEHIHLSKLKRNKNEIKKLIKKGLSYDFKRRLLSENKSLLKDILHVIFA